MENPDLFLPSWFSVVFHFAVPVEADTSNARVICYKKQLTICFKKHESIDFYTRFCMRLYVDLGTCVVASVKNDPTHLNGLNVN